MNELLIIVVVLWIFRLVTESKFLGCLADILTVIIIISWLGGVA